MLPSALAISRSPAVTLFQAGAADGAAHRQRIGFHILDHRRACGRGHLRFLYLCIPQDNLAGCAGQLQLFRLDIGHLCFAGGSNG